MDIKKIMPIAARRMRGPALLMHLLIIHGAAYAAVNKTSIDELRRIHVELQHLVEFIAV